MAGACGGLRRLAGGGRPGGQATARCAARREWHCWPLLPRRAAHDIIPASVAAAVLAVSENRVCHNSWEELMMLRVLAAAGVATILAVPSSVNAQVLMQPELSARMALTIAEAAWTECTARVSVAVVDRAGRMKAFIVGDGAAPHNIELAERKAYTARTFGRTSIEWAQRTETQTQGQRSLAKVIPLQGGVPVKVGEETIGGVGLSGAPNGGPQEEACGKAGIAKVADQLK